MIQRKSRAASSKAWMLGPALPMVLVASSSSFVSGCSGAPTQNATPTASATSSGSTVAVTSPVDTAAVAAPKGMFLNVRARNIGASLSALDLGGFEGDILSEGLREMRMRDLDVAQVKSVVAMDAPVDLVLAVTESGSADVLMGFSIGLKSVEESRKVLRAEAEVMPGMWRVEAGERSRLSCVVATSAGSTPARAICGPRARDVESLAPYLARTASMAPPPDADATLELSVAPLEARFGNDLKRLVPQAPRLARAEFGLNEPQFDKAIERGAGGLANEALALLADIDKLTLRVTLSSQAGVSVAGTLSYRGKTSWMAQTAMKAKNTALPPRFFRAPMDSDSATFLKIDDPADFAPILSVGKELIEGALAAEKAGSEADRKKVAALLDWPLVPGTELVVASGTKRVSKPVTPKTAQAKIIASLDNMFGWRVIGSNIKAEDAIKYLKNGIDAYNGAAVQSALKKADGGKGAPTMKTFAAPGKLGKGAFAAEVTFKDDGAKKTLMPLQVLIAPDGEGSWVGIGFNREELVERMVSVREGAPKEKTLDGRSDLAVLRAKRLSSGGYFTMASFVTMASGLFIGRPMPAPGQKAPSEEDELLKATNVVHEILAVLPNKGSSPIAMEASVEASTTRFSFLVPKGVLDDSRSLVAELTRRKEERRKEASASAKAEDKKPPVPGGGKAPAPKPPTPKK